VCLFTFIFEIAAHTWARTTFTQFYPKPQWTGYFGTFFWFLDVIAILSLFPDIPIIAKPLGIYGIGDTVNGGSNYAKAGRVVRLVRLVRLVKLYKVSAERRLRKQQDDELMELVRIGVIKEEDIVKQRALYNSRQSRLGDQLSASTTQRVIVMILVMIIILPILLYSEVNKGPSFATDLLHRFNVAQNVDDAAKNVVLDTFTTSFVETYHNRFIDYLLVTPSFTGEPGPQVYFASNLDSLRKVERQEEYLRTQLPSGQVYVTQVVFNRTFIVRQIATYSILMTIFVAIMMIGGSLVFTNDAQTLVIAPIERMMNMVEAVAAGT
jgi:hypothetical protein